MWKDFILSTCCVVQVFKESPEHFGALFHQVLRTCLRDPPDSDVDGQRAVHFRELTSLLLFLNHCFNSMEVEVLRMQVQRLVTLPMWTSLYDVSESSEPLSSQTNRSIII